MSDSRTNNGDISNKAIEPMTFEGKVVDNERYNGIDGLRAYAAIGIICMHVNSNSKYMLSGVLFNTIIPSLGKLVYLFMIISAFSLCCGYYKKILSGEFSLEKFYCKRYSKIWPFFCIMCLLDLIVSPSMNAAYEVFANLTLVFGLLPNPGITVIGVGWFLGLIFVFYIFFPFFCFLLFNRKRAVFYFIVAILFNHLCVIRFNAGSNNIIFCSSYFLLGGLIYLYKDKISELMEHLAFRMSVIIVSIISTICFYLFCLQDVWLLIPFGLMLIYVLNRDGKYYILSNRVTKMLSSISLEIFLSHMFIYRVLEKIGIFDFLNDGVFSYLITVLLTISGTILFSLLINRGIELFRSIIKVYKQK